MKKIVLTSALVLSSLVIAPPLYAHGDEKPQHGGIVQTSHDINFELVDGGDCAQIFIRDHGKAVSAQGYSGKLTLLRGSQKTDFPLSVDGNSLKAKGVQLQAGDKVMLQLTNPQQKQLSVRFALPK